MVAALLSRAAWRRPTRTWSRTSANRFERLQLFQCASAPFLSFGIVGVAFYAPCARRWDDERLDERTIERPDMFANDSTIPNDPNHSGCSQHGTGIRSRGKLTYG